MGLFFKTYLLGHIFQVDKDIKQSWSYHIVDLATNQQLKEKRAGIIKTRYKVDKYQCHVARWIEQYAQTRKIVKPDMGAGDTWGMVVSKESKGASKGERACYRMHIFKSF